MTRLFAVAAVAVLVVTNRLGAQINAQRDPSADRQSIIRIVTETSDAWNRRDAKGLAAHVTDDTDHIGVGGDWTSGKAALEQRFRQVLPAVQNTVTFSVEKIRFLSPDIAIAVIRRTYHYEKETSNAIGTSVFQRINGEWLTAAFQNTTVQRREQ